MRHIRVASGTLLAVTVLAGCSGVDTSPLDSGIPNASNTPPARSVPPPGEHWKGLRSRCPVLAGDAARRIGVAGDGTSTDRYTTDATVTNADCHWGSTDDHGTAVNARISIWARQSAADAQWQTLSTGQTRQIRVGDEGFVTDEGGSVVVRTRSGNAVATVRLVAAPDASDASLNDAAGQIADDVLDDLVPG